METRQSCKEVVFPWFQEFFGLCDSPPSPAKLPAPAHHYEGNLISEGQAADLFDADETPADKLSRTTSGRGSK